MDYAAFPALPPSLQLRQHGVDCFPTVVLGREREYLYEHGLHDVLQLKIRARVLRGRDLERVVRVVLPIRLAIRFGGIAD